MVAARIAADRRCGVTGVSSPAVLCLDFDGTITRRDVTDCILERFADRAWLDVERAWVAGEIGSRECLTRQMALVRAEPRELDTLLDTIEVDAGFVALADACGARDVALHIVSDGFDYCIQRILGRPEFRSRIARAHIVSSGLEWTGTGWRTFFQHPVDACEHGCATCKPLALARLRGDAPLAIFVGDGLSDRHAAATGAVLFAKSALARFCAEASIPFLAYESLAEVADGIERLLGAAAGHPSKVCELQ
jgi:2-hydroxy-3-keto-5-methylthiopentenyl-1-phosphate phosphatase